MKTLLSIIVVVFAFSSHAVAQQAVVKKAEQPSAAEQAVLKLTDEWLAADAKQDAATLNRIIADDFLATTPGGDVLTKKMLVPEGKTEGGGLALAPKDLKARAYGDMAVVTGRGTSQGQVKGDFRFTVVYVKRQDRWQMVAVHLSNITHQTAAPQQ